MNKEVYLSLNDASFSVGKKKLLREVSLVVHEHDKIALVGKNGAGKTTLLDIIGKRKIIDSGDLWNNPRVRLGFLDQRDKILNDLSVNKYLLYEGSGERLFDQYNIERTCNELKLDIKKNCNSLSGGERRKLNLVFALLLNPNLLLLDEPTNHLDIESINWLEEYLKNEFKGSFIVISHNREFLKNVTNKVFWIDRGSIKISPKGFLEFENWKNLQIEQEKRELRNKKQILDDEIDWLSRGVKARRKRNIKRKDNVKILKDSYEKENTEFKKAISKIQIPTKSANIEDGSNILINFINVKKSFFLENRVISILKNFNYKFVRGEKIGIIGRNGSGKSTFLNLASNEITPDQGNIKIRKKINFSFFDQSGKQFDDKKTIKDNLIPSGGDYIKVVDKKIHICGYLKNFLFDPSEVDREVLTLSGGERNRLLLAKILAAPKEILILDEPTNDLDIETIDLLIDFINLHKGGSLISSHDLDFLRKTCSKFFILDGLGNIKVSLNLESSYHLEKDKNNFQHTMTKKNVKPVNTEKIIDRIVKKIEKKELEISNLTKEMQLTQNYNHKSLHYQNLIGHLKKIQNELELLEKEWLEIEESSLSK